MGVPPTSAIRGDTSSKPWQRLGSVMANAPWLGGLQYTIAQIFRVPSHQAHLPEQDVDKMKKLAELAAMQ